MKLFLKRDAVASSSDVDGVLGEMRKLQDLTEVAFNEYSGAQRILQSRSEKILELSNRLRNGAHPVRERARLEDDLRRMQDTKSLEETVRIKRAAYEDARKKLKEVTERFNASYLAVELPEAK